MRVKLVFHPLALISGTLMLAGICALGFAGWGYLDSWVYQERLEAAFDAERAAGPIEYTFPEPETVVQPAATRRRTPAPRPVDGAIARVAVPRLGIWAFVAEGIDDVTLRRAIGHIPGTARPGEGGNVGLAGHRDTFFRKLRYLERGDRIVLSTKTQDLEYRVTLMAIVAPDYVKAIEPSRSPILTIVTCYPFGYLGSAPKRFIVQAEGFHQNY